MGISIYIALKSELNRNVSLLKKKKKKSLSSSYKIRIDIH